MTWQNFNFVQVPLLVKESMTEEEKEIAVEKQVRIGIDLSPGCTFFIQVSCIQLLFQLIPPVHLALLKDLLLFLQAVF